MNVTLRVFAGILDLLQFVFFIVLLAFQLMTPAGGAAIGGVSGAVLCWNLSSGVISGVLNALSCLAGGGVLGAGISLIATPLGMVIDVSLSCTFGVLLILLLWVTGRFSLMAVALGFTAELLPGINGFAPGWSILVHRCIQEYNRKQRGMRASKSKMAGVLSTAAMLVPGEGAAAIALRTASRAASAAPAQQRAEPAGRVPLQTKNFDGIRPANDNTPQPYAAAA